MKKVCHCAHCLIEAECYDNDWSIFIADDPCCPNMKEGREQHKNFLEDYFNERFY